jgi:predicted deacetylase
MPAQPTAPPPSPPARGLHVAVHDVTPAHRGRLERIDAQLAALGVGARYSMLVVPDFHRRAALAAAPEFARWLRARADAGVEMLLHGFFHVDETAHRSARARWLATAMTAREGEFLGLGRDEARRRLDAGRRVLEDAIGRGIDGFVAPAWLYGPGARAALRDAGFRLAEDHWSVWSPADGRTLLRSPVVSWASRTPARLASSLAWSKVATLALAPLPIVRVGIHPQDGEHGVLVHEIERVVASFLRSRPPILLRELLP